MGVPLHGQVSASASAQQLTSNTSQVAAFTIKAPASNTAPVFIGASAVTTANGHQLDPGDTVDYQVEVQNGQTRLELRPSDFYVVSAGSGTTVVTWLASP